MDKNELRGQDAFISLSDRVLSFIDQHSKIFLGLFAVIVVGGISYVTMGYLNSRTEHLAAEAIYQAEAELNKVKGPDEETNPTKKQPAADDYEKKYSSAVNKIQSQIQSHADTKASLISALNLSLFLVSQKQYSEALKVLSLPKYRPKASDILAGFWNMHRGLVFLENKEVQKAMDSYQSVLQSTGLKLFHSEAMLKLGYCQELNGDLTKARELYEKVEREFPNTEAAQSAQQYMRVMQLKSPKQG